MKSVIRWAVNNSPAMNTLMIGVLVVGMFSLLSLRREEFPAFELEIILVSVPYPGASPEEVESGICQKIEEAVRSIDGIKKQTSVAQEGAANLVLELEADVPDVQKILNEVRSEIDRIPSFPELAEDPEVKQITMRRPAIRVGVIGPDRDDPEAEWKLRDISETIRDEVLQLPSITQAELSGVRPYQIDIEISEDTLRKYGLSLQDVARTVRRENIELPGGSMKTPSEEVLLRGKNKRRIGEEIANIPLVTEASGVVLTVDDLGTVRDAFADTTAISRINGQPGMVVSVEGTAREDLLAMTDEVKEYVAAKEMPAGYKLITWGDRSEHVNDRLNLLRKNGLQGLLLVFLVLALFLESRLAFWVALGIPISILGACGVLLLLDQTLNMLSMFSFLMALGIVVDDAIVIGENIYAHRQMGKGHIQAAIEGTYEVLPSVAASVTTTIIAFMPMFFVAGVMGKFFAVLPLAIVAMLIISLIESTFILPCHLGHTEWKVKEQIRATCNRMPTPVYLLLGVPILVVVWVAGVFLYPLKTLERGCHWVNARTERFLSWFCESAYRPSLRWALARPGVTVSLSVGLLLVAFGAIRGGFVPYVFFPKLDSNTIEAKIIYPNGTPARVTDAATRQLEQAFQTINAEYAAQEQPLLRSIYRNVGQLSTGGFAGGNERTDGSHVGSVQVELVDTSQREMKSQQIVSAWREAAGEFPGAESVQFGSMSHGPAGSPIEFKLLAPSEDMDLLESAVRDTKAALGKYPGVYDIDDDSRPGKWEFQLKVKEKALAMGVTAADLAETVRASYYGEEVMRLQRGRHEVKLMVRYPPEERRSLADFEDIRVRTGDGLERPLTELADLTIKRGYSEINRINQKRSITVSADVNEAIGNAYDIVNHFKENPQPAFGERLMAILSGRPQEEQLGPLNQILANYPGVTVRWEGQQEQREESISSLFIGFGVAMLAMYVLLTLEFNSYLQPAMIMFIIPFGVIGAVGGHWLMGLPLTLFSMLGLVALTGVVVNDSIVLIDFINHRVRDGLPLKEALIDAGMRRFRPVLLTSVTTIAGLMPILLETSFQAQILIPMAASLCFGLALATVLVLVLIPTYYFIYATALGVGISDEPEEKAPPVEPPAPLAAEEETVIESTATAPRSAGAPVSQSYREPDR